MRIRSLALSVTALALLSPLAACSGDDDPKSDSDKSGDSSSNGSGNGDDNVAGPKEPSLKVPDCPFTAKKLSKELDLEFKVNKKNDCVFEAEKGQERISVTLDRAADNETYDADLAIFEDSWDNVEELSVDGKGYVAWSDDELNIAVGYLDNAGAYRFQISAVTPDAVGADDAVDLAEELIELTVSARKA